MSVKGLCAALLSVATIFAISAVAQDEKNEIGGVLGRTFIKASRMRRILIRSFIRARG